MLADLLVGEIGSVLLVFARLGAALMVVPGLGEHYVLPRLRLLLALALSLLLAPARGVVASALRLARLRLDVASQHVLRAAFETAERGRAGADQPVDLATLRGLRSWPRSWLALVTRSLRWRGLVELRERGIVLTPAGQVDALRITRNHRLWEQFLVTYADLAPSHVDHSADLVEHILSPEMIAELERELGARGRLPRGLDVPPSVHPLGSGAA